MEIERTSVDTLCGIVVCICVLLSEWASAVLRLCAEDADWMRTGRLKSSSNSAWQSR